MEVIRWIPGGDFGELIKVCLSWHAVDGIRWNLRPWIRFEKLDLESTQSVSLDKLILITTSCYKTLNFLVGFG